MAALLCVQAWQTRAVPSGTIENFEIVLLQADGSVKATSFQQWRAQYPHQPVVLHFWADWCPICRTEEGSISQLTQDWPVLTVAMQSGQAADVAKVLQKRQLLWATAVDTSGTITRLFGFKGVPAFVIVDSAGQIRAPTMGYTSEIGMRLRLWWVSVSGG